MCMRLRERTQARAHADIAHAPRAIALETVFETVFVTMFETVFRTVPQTVLRLSLPAPSPSSP